MADLCRGKRVVVFAVPGAFTPGCSRTHLPGFVKDADKLKAKGVDEIICVSVNDPFVMGAWGEAHGAGGKVRMLADTNAEFTRAMQQDLMLGPLGGVRSARYACLIEDGAINKFSGEPADDPTGMTCSLAPALFALL
jgi:2-Cys peroxiredoxin 5